MRTVIIMIIHLIIITLPYLLLSLLSFYIVYSYHHHYHSTWYVLVLLTSLSYTTAFYLMEWILFLLFLIVPETDLLCWAGNQKMSTTKQRSAAFP